MCWACRTADARLAHALAVRQSGPCNSNTLFVVPGISRHDRDAAVTTGGVPYASGG